jgi:hypothetical protein
MESGLPYWFKPYGKGDFNALKSQDTDTDTDTA